MKGKQRCKWHWLHVQPKDVQQREAQARKAKKIGTDRARVPRGEWPDGHRWCSGCQSYVPLFYTTGSRCRACASGAAHERRVIDTYGLRPGEYDALMKLQGGRCFVCRRRPGQRRLAVDHDHATGRPRGLLCSDNERGCNHKVLGILEAASVDGLLAAARRLVSYLEHPPYERLGLEPAITLGPVQDEAAPPPF